MADKKFEDGRKLQKLETQITALYEEIYSRSGKDNPAQRARLREIMERAFHSYFDLALEYRISPQEVQNVSIIFQKAIDENYDPNSL